MFDFSFGELMLVGVIALVVFLLLFTPWRINVLLLGIDPTNDHSAMGRSDTMILLQLDTETGEVKLVSFLRDLYVAIPGNGKTRLNAALKNRRLFQFKEDDAK